MAMASITRRNSISIAKSLPYLSTFSRRFSAVRSDENDIVVGGAVSGGYVAAVKAAQLGLNTTCIQKRTALGGTSLNVGCIPSNTLLHSTHEAKHAFANHGVKCSSVEMDVAAMMAPKDGMLASPSEVSVGTIEGGNTFVKDKNIIIDTGSGVKPFSGIRIDKKTIRLDVILVHLHFCETIPQARQLISHGKVCVNNGIAKKTSLKVYPGDVISFQENDARTREEVIRRFFFINASVDKVIGKLRGRWLRMGLGKRSRLGRSSKAGHFRLLKKKREWLRLLKKKKGCSLLLKSRFLQKLHSSMQEKDMEKIKKFGYKKVCLGSSLGDLSRMKRSFYNSVTSSFFLSKMTSNGRNLNVPTRTRSSIGYNYRYGHLICCCASSYPFSMKRKKRKINKKVKRIKLPTLYSEVNHRTLKAVVFYIPNIDPSSCQHKKITKRRLSRGGLPITKKWS